MFWPGFPFANNSGNGQTKNLTAQLVQRLCARQNMLGNRLPRYLIDPLLCDQTPPPPPTPTLTITADPMSVVVNATSTLSWDSSNAIACVASNGWTGSKSLDGSEPVTVSATTTYTISCGNGVSTSTDSVTVNVTPGPAAPSLSFSANPTNLVQGSASLSTSTLTWDSTNADSCNASNGWSGSKTVDGSQVVQPTGTTSITYVLTCTGTGGPVTQSVTLTVGTTTPTVDLSANPTNVTPGAGSATSTLTWTSTDATLCLASGGWSGERSPSGTQIVEPSATTTYVLDCSNSVGTSTDSVTVNFVPDEEPEPSVDHILISEVFSDVDAAHGADMTNEWIELYNPTGSSVDLSFWTIADITTVDDAVTNDILPSGTSIAAGGFLVIVNASTTPNFWIIPGGVPIIALENALGSGLNNTSEALYLRNAATTTIDSLSWGSNTDGFVSGSGAADVIPGHSLVRLNLNVDTGTNADWTDDATPAPGQAN